MTLYVYDKDPGDGTSNCTGRCLAVVAAGHRHRHADLRRRHAAESDFTVSAAKQLVVNGMPLYTFASDTAPGDTTGQDVGDFYAAGADGKKIDNS